MRDSYEEELLINTYYDAKIYGVSISECCKAIEELMKSSIEYIKEKEEQERIYNEYIAEMKKKAIERREKNSNKDSLFKI